MEGWTAAAASPGWPISQAGRTVDAEFYSSIGWLMKVA
jgi:hypothetical protein